MARRRLDVQEVELERTIKAHRMAVDRNMPATATVTGAKLKRYEFQVKLSREQVKELEIACSQGELPLEAAIKASKKA